MIGMVLVCWPYRVTRAVGWVLVVGFLAKHDASMGYPISGLRRTGLPSGSNSGATRLFTRNRHGEITAGGGSAALDSGSSQEAGPSFASSVVGPFQQRPHAAALTALLYLPQFAAAWASSTSTEVSEPQPQSLLHVAACRAVDSSVPASRVVSHCPIVT